MEENDYIPPSSNNDDYQPPNLGIDIQNEKVEEQKEDNE